MKIGNTDIVNPTIGTTPINKVFIGANLVWERVEAFVFTIDTTLSNGTLNFEFDPTTIAPINYTIDWGDGNVDNITTSGATIHSYVTAGQYDITISGQGLGNYRFQNSTDRGKIIDVKVWGSLQLNSFNTAFGNCLNFPTTFSAIDSPDLSLCTILSAAFRNCFNFNTDLSNWNVSNIITLYETFRNCFNFNQDLSSWDTSNVISLYRTFQDCTNFNGNVTTWNTSNVTIISEIFNDCVNFNQDLSSWDVSSVTNFYGAFYGASSFVGNGLTNWNVSSAIDFGNIFRNCFNFNQDLSSWDTSNVISFDRCFQNCSSFLGDGISSWDVTSLVNAGNFLNGSAFTDSNYQNTLVGWTGWNGTTATKTLQSNVTVHFGTARYEIGGASEDARNYLINTLGWTIIDGGGV